MTGSLSHSSAASSATSPDNSKMRQVANDRVDFGPVFDVKLDTLIAPA
jgi:hypothetical protein